MNSQDVKNAISGVLVVDKRELHPGVGQAGIEMEPCHQVEPGNRLCGAEADHGAQGSFLDQGNLGCHGCFTPSRTVNQRRAVGRPSCQLDPPLVLRKLDHAHGGRGAIGIDHVNPVVIVLSATPERDPAFDSVIVIWDSSGIDLTTGLSVDLQFCSGLAQQMGAAQTYIAIQVDSVRPDQRNVFKHEWGHSILFYYEAAGTAPHPAVDNHINESDHRYVHCRTGEAYILEDESDENPIPNSIYNNETGFSHDYYSGTTARPEAPDRCLGITPEAWASGGPVTKPAPTPAGANGLPRAPTRTDPGTILIPSTGRPRRDAINRQASLPALPSLPAIPCPECCNKPNPAPCRPAGWSDCAGRPRASPPGARLPARNAHCACRP